MKEEELPSEVLKLGILRCLRNHTQTSEYKWNILGNASGRASELEIQLGVTFDARTRFHASQCFDQLRTDGFIVPQISDFNRNPEDHVIITEKGLQALDDGVVDAEPRVASSSGLSNFGIPDLRVFRSEVSKLSDQDLVSCLFMDLDNFKSVNDQHNHSVGDQVIQEVIRITEGIVSGKGSVFHRSGDEIVILLQNFSVEEACAVAERIRQTIEGHDFPVIGKGFVTATLGAATSPTFCTLADLEVAADKAAMDAKKLGKNLVQACSNEALLPTNLIPKTPYRRELEDMLMELKANATVAGLQGNDRIDYSANKLDPMALSTLSDNARETVDSAYGAVKKIQLLVRRFENATSHNAIVDTGNALIEFKFRELPKITKAIQTLQDCLDGPLGG